MHRNMILTRLLKLLKINLSYLELFNQSFYHGYLKIKGLKYIYVLFHRVVTKISSRRGIKQLGISFGSIFLLFSNKSSRGPLSQQPGKIPGSRLLMTTLKISIQTYRIFYLTQRLFAKHHTFSDAHADSYPHRGTKGVGGGVDGTPPRSF